jgi:hypothetical protein
MSFATRSGSSLQQQKQQIDAINEKFKSEASSARPPLTSDEITTFKRNNLITTLKQMPFEDLHELAVCCENEVISRRERRTREVGKSFEDDDWRCKPRESTVGTDIHLTKEQGGSAASEGSQRPTATSKDQRMTVNVGGTYFMTSAETLCRESGSALTMWLTEMNDSSTDDEELFFDRSPELFSRILNYLRGDDTIVEDMSNVELRRLLKETEFYSLSRLTEMVEARLLSTRATPSQKSKQSGVGGIVNWGEQESTERLKQS